ncbi:hypothetical protein [Antarcticirhabdus aurantiaca]|uniref:Uncharacterized protein n=1 Tax=Antarcticirhabdus aurantiaca TaxID=2606717 RepID=A0ACD4NL65_9HYPH|nr:hypothetical protein [Antarcticirhabdus aurantiaca]WAJ27539.1 hypothetical protein OXU80_22260 [Jeongeuplla avenae]
MLPGWSDGDIMGCDLVRLHVALDTARKRIEAESRERYRLAGYKVPEPIDTEELDDDAFNAQIRGTVALMRARAA